MLITQAQNKVYRTYCLVCGEDAEQLVIGETMKYVGEKGNVIGYGHPGGVLAQRLIEHGIEYTSHMLRGAEKAPAGEPCSNCSAEMALQRKRNEQEVIDGGVYWECVSCGLFGIIIADDTLGFAVAARGQTGIQPPKQVCVVFANCGQHASEEDPTSNTIH